MTTARRNDGLAFGASALLLAAALAHAGDVRLRATATVSRGEPVRLGQVASLDGKDALALSDVVIVADPLTAAAGRPWVEVSVEDVRRALSEADVRLNALALSGRSCTVRITGSNGAVEPVRRRPGKPEPRSAGALGVPTVRMQASAVLASMLGVEREDLRLTFDERDAEFLDEPRSGVRVAVQPVSAGGSARAVLAVRITEGDRMIESRSVRVDVQVRRRVVVLQSAVRRKDEIDASLLSEQVAWMPAGAGRPIASIDEAAGSLARSRLNAGTILLAEHLETPVVVRRNELVTVHVVRGGFEVKTRARARADARRDEVVEFRMEGSKTWFSARVAGPGVAVADVDGPAAVNEEGRK